MTEKRVPDASSKLKFVELYRTIYKKVKMVGKGERSRPEWANGERVSEDLLTKAIDQGADLLPYCYQEAYVTPLRKNLKLVIKQKLDSVQIENIIGAIYDHSAKSVANELHQLLAVISNLYRTFLRAPGYESRRLKLTYVNPPLATFQYEMTLDDPTPSTLPVDEVALLFGGGVGVVIVPDTYRKHPVLWTALVHEVGGHDLLHADISLLPELESHMLGLFGPCVIENQRTKDFMRRLWKYWIGEAAADICGVLNMGPTYAYSAAICAAALNKDLMSSIKKYAPAIRDQLDALDKKMREQPMLFTSPPPGGMTDLDTHPTDVLRLYMMMGAILGLEGLSHDRKQKYCSELETFISKDTINENGDTRKETDNVHLKGYLQTGPDTWETVDENLPLSLMKQCAMEVGYSVVTQEFESLEKKDGKRQNIQALVSWNDKQEANAKEIMRLLLESEKNSIDTAGDDSQLLAGATHALLRNPDPTFYDSVNKRLGKALTKSFDRDEVWGYPALTRFWSPSPLTSSGPVSEISR